MEVQLTPNGKLSGHGGAICINVHLLTFHHLIDQQDEIRSQKIIFYANQNSKKTIASHEKSPHPPPPTWACSPCPPSSRPLQCSALAPPCLCNSPKPSVGRVFVKDQLAEYTFLLTSSSILHFFVVVLPWQVLQPREPFLCLLPPPLRSPGRFVLPNESNITQKNCSTC